MKKRILIVLATLTMLLCVPIITHAQIIDSGDCGADGDNLTWTLDDEGTLTISGEGDMADYHAYDSRYGISAPWRRSQLNTTKVIIEPGITSIGDYAFNECSDLISINISDSVTNIGVYAFNNCTSLTRINIPDSMTNINYGTFYGCTSLTSVTFPDSVTSIYGLAFYNCASLTKINIPEDVISIDYEAFSGCGSLNIYVNPNNQNYCDIDGVLFTKDKKTILAYAKDKLQPEYTIPNGVTSISDCAFEYCGSLTNLNIPDSVTSIGEHAFSECTSLTNITIPDSVTNIDWGTFSYCTSLTSITIPDSVTSIGRYTFEHCESLTNITIPDSVTSIGSFAFCGCGMTSIRIPYGVTSIESNTFAGCSRLTDVIIPANITSISDHAFYECINLTNITIPSTVTSIGLMAFEGTGYYNNTANWVNNVLYIGDCLICVNDKLSGTYDIKGGTRLIAGNAFAYCKSLTSITIPDSVTSIGFMAFYGCEGLTDVYYLGTEQEWLKLVEMGRGDGNDKLFKATIHFAKIQNNPLEVQPVEPEVDTRANKIKIPVTVTDAERAEELNDVRLYIAEYDADGRLTNVTFGDNGAVEGDTITFTADIPNAEHYKIMLWDANNAPLMGAVDDIYAYTEQ